MKISPPYLIQACRHVLLDALVYIYMNFSWSNKFDQSQSPENGQILTILQKIISSEYFPSILSSQWVTESCIYLKIYILEDSIRAEIQFPWCDGPQLTNWPLAHTHIHTYILNDFAESSTIQQHTYTQWIGFIQVISLWSCTATRVTQTRTLHKNHVKG